MRIICFGELLVEFTTTEPGKTLSRVDTFRKQAAGSALAISSALSAQHGVSTSLWTKVGNDSLGRFLRETVHAAGLSTSGIAADEVHPTRIAFIGVNESGDRYAEYHNRDSATRYIRPGDLDFQLLEEAGIVHFGGEVLLGETTFRTTLQLLRLARSNNCLISFNPNIRLDIIGNAIEVSARMKKILAYVDILRVSVEDWTAFFSRLAPDQLLKEYLALLIMSEGTDGVRLLTRQQRVFIAAESTTTDTPAADDAFIAAFLAAIAHDKAARPPQFTVEQLTTWGRFAARWAAQAGDSVRITGAYSGRPDSSNN